jgi:hypothetical protein
MLFLAASEPAKGASVHDLLIGAAVGAVLTVAVLYVASGHRAGRIKWLGRLAGFSERVSGLPGWCALPSAIVGSSLCIAVFGFYWDVAKHIDTGRDPSPFGTPAHYPILIGLGGIALGGVVAVVLGAPKSVPTSLRITRDWYAPLGGVLTLLCGGFALLGFPLDDVWHRLFGQDVTLWGPTHLMLIGGAGMTLIGQAVLLQEGVRARPPRPGRSPRGMLARHEMLRQVALMGGLLVGLSTFQAEFDFGVPQFRAVLQPAMIALAAGVALVAARVWIGRGGALGAALFFLALRGFVALLVGPVLGETTPSLPLYLGEALLVEAAAVLLVRRDRVMFGAVAGFLAGTVGFASEWAWTHVAFRLPWEEALLPEGLVVAAVAGTAAGVLGALIGLALRAELPRPVPTRALAAVASLALIAALVDGLYETAPPSVNTAMTVTPADGPGEPVNVGVRLDPPDAAADATWFQVTAWQGDGLVVNRLVSDGADGWRTTQPIPVDGDWKVQLRLQTGRAVMGAPIRLPADPAIPADEVPAAPSAERPMAPDRTLLQRERKGDVPGWLWGGASAIVLALALVFLGALAWGLGRVARTAKPSSPPPGPPAPRLAREPSAAGV